MLITGLNGPVNGWNFGNIGGTYLRKYLDPDLENNSGGKSTQHWIDIRYASAALKGWEGLCREKITPEGDLRDICVGTGIGNDMPFYYNRPKVDGETHGTGLLLDAGLEILRLKEKLNL